MFDGGISHASVRRLLPEAPCPVSPAWIAPAMSRIAITGARGFIGRRLTAVLRAQGHEVIALGRTPAASGMVRAWQLGDELPADCSSADTVIHLASAALTGSASLQRAAELDIEGSRRVLAQLRAWRRDGRRCRFIFLSSQSARPDARNVYGRSKWAIERLLTEPDEIIVRPGLVYGDPPASVFASFDRLARLPAVPVVGTRPSIQPIEVGELCDCLARIATMEQPPPLLQLGAVEPLSFAEALRQTALRAGRRPPLMIPLPVPPLRLLTGVIDRLFRSRLTERLDGVIGLQPLDTAPSLAALGRTLAPFGADPAAWAVSP
jgi:NADH dehydrogenase